MSRIYSAMSDQEDEVLDQVMVDLDLAKSNGSIRTEEYDIDYNPDEGSYLVTDNDTQEKTKILGDDQILMMEGIEDANNGIPDPESEDAGLQVNDRVIWTDLSGAVHTGVLTMIAAGMGTAIDDITGGEVTQLLSTFNIVSDSEESFSARQNKLMMRVGSYDLELNIDEAICDVIGEGVNFKFNPDKSFGKVMEEILSKMKKNGLKNFSLVIDRTEKTFSEKCQRKVSFSLVK